jgi:uncharacterized protein (TIGR03000 family)
VLVVLTPGKSEAQRRGFGYRGMGGYGGYGGSGGYGLGYGGYGLGYGGYGLGYGGYGLYGPGYTGLSYGMPYYGGAYDMAAAPYSGQPYGMYNPSNSYQSFYPANMNGRQGSAGIQVRVAPDAEIWFDGTKMKQTGAVREYQTPPLTPGKAFTYEVKARWMQDGEPVEQTRTVEVQVGRQAVVDFTSPQK